MKIKGVLYFSSQRFAQQTPSSSSATQAAGAVAPFTLDIICSANAE